MEIYIFRDGEQFGPYTPEEVRDYLAQRALLPADLAWCEGLETWVALGQIMLPCPPERRPPPPAKLPVKRGTFSPVLPPLIPGLPDGAFFAASQLNAFIVIPTSLSDELTRETAADLLDLRLAAPRITRLTFLDDGIEVAKRDGLVMEGKDFAHFGSYAFTEKFLRAMPEYVSTADQIYPATTDENGREVAAFFLLLAPIAERVEEVTGITSGPLGSRILVVEYVSAYLFPPGMEGIVPYVYTGQRNRTSFQRYDDGWRALDDIS